MKHVFTIILLIFSLASSAQKIRFSNHHNVWTSMGDGMAVCPFTLTLSYGTDTVISGQVYQHLIPNFSCGYTPGCSCWLPPPNYLIKEDTVTGIIYYRDLSSSTPDTVDQIYFNYNLHIGDTINSGGDSIAAIDSTIINGIYHKIYTIAPPSGGLLWTFVEGVGSMTFPYPNFFDGCFEFSQNLVCFQQNGIFPTMNFRYAHCAFGDSFINTAGCATLSINNYPKPSSPINVVPNPAYDHIDITCPEKFDNNTFISVYDITGRCVYNAKADESKNSMTISTSSWHNGLYVAAVQNNAGVIKRDKIVVLK